MGDQVPKLSKDFRDLATQNLPRYQYIHEQ